MEPIAKARDRLLQRTARALGLGGTAIAVASLSIPGVLGVDVLVTVLPLLVVMAFSQFQVGRSRSLVWVLLGLVAGVGVLVVAQLPLAERPTDAVGTALVPVAGLALAAFAVVLTNGPLRIAILSVSVVTAAALTELATADANSVSAEAIAVVFAWLLCTVLGYWLSSSVPRAARRIFSIGRAHRAERQASETEAQRRQSARLLHDTVLATLTLLAHSGVGVATSAMQQQAKDDARLLRQLRLGATPKPQSSGSYTLETGEEIALGTTLESVKQRFGRMGLEVSWHGTGQVLLPSEVLDAFLLALAECLENVRRHSGVTDAHVTITDDETTVRAMVTDAGVGFNLSDVDAARMGLKESVMGRLNEVGGRARLFSSAGAGTTVVLEVPK
ncbi:sensor histidine kinase [Parafrigoribacterium mesophilum]|uniref:sensor histidine kinase n=1 Tax=Parafrigoribacterium mesophilum TaxID=433646 RepID=UPI0031FE2357